MTEDLKRKFEGETDLIVKENISGYRTICEKFTRNKANQNYKCYMAIEIGRDELSKALYNKLTDQQILRIDYDYEKFQEKFNAEMNKSEN